MDKVLLRITLISNYKFSENQMVYFTGIATKVLLYPIKGDFLNDFNV